MKNKFFIIAAILLVATTTITIVSCKKDKQAENAAKNIVLSENENVDNMDEYLLSFKAKLLNATKGDETISLEQARCDLTNLLNFDFGDANYATDVFQYDTIYVKLSQINGMVDLSQLAVTYNDALTKILASYRALDLSDKSVYSIFCEYDTNSKDENTEEMRIAVTYRGYNGNNTPFIMNGHDTLSWQPRRMDTSCDDPSMPYGGAVVMQHWLMNSQQQISCPNGGRLYFTNENDWFKNGYNTFDMATNRYKIFTVFTYRIDTVCISHEDMEYYYTNILDYYYQEVSSPRAIEFVYIDTDQIPYGPQNINGYPGDCWSWRIWIKYGKANCTETDPLY